ncbi:prepilin-type N-terminal cleavage/methylation domain-containing protein [Gilliamella sp. B2776]|uniref:type IV pilus modification PilV family protein n=1 Tax=unclassified Gilliamella TaxID=2685620 RepID=UPI00226AC6E0|nr:MULTISPECIES: prepilin-type N-terminal cleavage/methylation domain-containing protein [unclassified Gilliamella]MCX8649432.1 prepilin-type N-terminal cleavage/methylation domain-containing protein [Gilliamella sp. B2779]MCX8654706.1 prepilin-type N-terminal cleavage/methylation domain-containing protein [Gilliamella sp. B2737]MCX8655727.1 prepilin-type N-terminal cleavage/methylation domain-containing protein [Gilliamella sp. B2894]MCX8663829.1 prepilin-type N-terminal cleavage/methylation d
MNNKNIMGFSLVEVMIASLLFSIVILGFTGYQQSLIYQYHYLSNQLQAEQIAFELLESYPEITNDIIPNDWQYTLKSEQYNIRCKMIFVTVTPMNYKSVNQQRLFCH